METWWQRAFAEAGGVMDYGQFVGLVLYDPDHGYYRRRRARVGRAEGTDFTTATAVGPEFGQLLIAAAVARLREAGRDPAAHSWLEVGAEPERTVLDGVTHPFRVAQVRRIGEGGPLEGPLVVFGNEVLDAQPFRRFRFRRGRWHELGVALAADDPGRLMEVELGPVAQADPIGPGLPMESQEGYTVDWACGAETWLRELVAQPWEGLLFLADYGRTWADLVENFPEGTARSYVAHRQDADLLATPGERDLTCHVVWDRLEAILEGSGFTGVATQRQEAFLMRAAGPVLESAMAARPGEAPTARIARVQAMKAVLHPAYYGTRFQVLSGLRRGGRR